MQPESEKLQLEVKKLKHETSFLGTFATMVLPMFVSSTTAFVAILGIAISIYTLRQQRAIETAQENHKALQVALDMATDNKGGVDRRISGIYQLQRFWDDRDSEQLIAATLAAILVLPSSTANAPRARCAAAQVLSGAFKSESSSPERDQRLARFLYGDRDGNLGLVSQENWLISNHPESLAEHHSPDSRVATVNCDTPLAATREAIRKNWAHLRGANLQGNDLSYTQLYEADLDTSLLMKTRLVATNLKCANLNDVHIQGFAPADKPFVRFASISGVDDVSFLRYARAKGAVELSDDDWSRWQARGFSGFVLRDILGVRFPAHLDPSKVATMCHIAGDAASRTL